jgi:hypothetical protein
LNLFFGEIGSGVNAGEDPILHPIRLGTIGELRAIVDDLKQAITAPSDRIAHQPIRLCEASDNLTCDVHGGKIG